LYKHIYNISTAFSVGMTDISIGQAVDTIMKRLVYLYSLSEARVEDLQLLMTNRFNVYKEDSSAHSRLLSDVESQASEIFRKVSAINLQAIVSSVTALTDQITSINGRLDSHDKNLSLLSGGISSLNDVSEEALESVLKRTLDPISDQVAGSSTNVSNIIPALSNVQKSVNCVMDSIKAERTIVTDRIVRLFETGNLVLATNHRVIRTSNNFLFPLGSRPIMSFDYCVTLLPTTIIAKSSINLQLEDGYVFQISSNPILGSIDDSVEFVYAGNSYPSIC
jgi:hypothetical protein